MLLVCEALISDLKTCFDIKIFKLNPFCWSDRGSHVRGLQRSLVFLRGAQSSNAQMLLIAAAVVGWPQRQPARTNNRTNINNITEEQQQQTQ